MWVWVLPFVLSVAHILTLVVATEGSRRLRTSRHSLGVDALLCPETRDHITAHLSSLGVKRDLVPLHKATLAWQEGLDHPNSGPPSPGICSPGLGLPFPAASSLNRSEDPV